MAAFTYKFADCAVHKVSAQAVGEICERLEKQNGACTPQALLDESRDPSAPLHNEFDWDDTVAAEKWRIEQARMLIKDVRIIRSDDTQERKMYHERGFVSTPGGRGAYVSMDAALQKEEYMNNLLAQAKREMLCFIAKYRRVKELAGVVGEMERFMDTE